MEYQSFFMILKSFTFSNDLFLCPNPQTAHGYVKIKKEITQYFVTIHLNNFSQPANAYIVCKTNIAKIVLSGNITTVPVSFAIEDYATVFIDTYNLFASKNGTIMCGENYKKVLEYDLIKSEKAETKRKTTLEKIFGVVHDTYFFDCIKPQLASLFSMGKSNGKFEKLFENSKWTQISHNNTTMVFGVIYKDNFATTIAVGSPTQFCAKEMTKEYFVDGQNYNIVFLDASNGKIINI